MLVERRQTGARCHDVTGLLNRLWATLVRVRKEAAAVGRLCVVFAHSLTRDIRLKDEVVPVRLQLVTGGAVGARSPQLDTLV